MIASGVWQNRSQARLNDYQQDEQMVGKYIDVLYQSVISNRGLDMQKARMGYVKRFRALIDQDLEDARADSHAGFHSA